MIITPVVVYFTQSGEKTAQRIARKLNAPLHRFKPKNRQSLAAVDVYFDNTRDHFCTLFSGGIPIIGVCACGIIIRSLAPLLVNKSVESPIIALSHDGAVVIPLLGGHHGGNRLARRIAKIFNGTACITTAGDTTLGIALDSPPSGWKLANPAIAKSFMSALLSGDKVQINNPPDWFKNTSLISTSNAALHITCTTAPVTPSDKNLVFHPQKYTLGLGCVRDCDRQEMWQLVQASLAKINVAAKSVAAVASLDLKADEQAILFIAAQLNVPYRVFTAAALNRHRNALINPSHAVFAEVGCYGVAEAAALAVIDQKVNPTLALEKQKSKNATCAIAVASQPITQFFGRNRGKLSLVGIGPGHASWRTPQASRLINQADELVGYRLYLDLLGVAAHNKPCRNFPLGTEESRCRYALEQAGRGKNITLICSGDAGIYAMAALVFELLDSTSPYNNVSDAACRVEIECAAGITAMQAAAARTGAPLGHDFCAISLSDLLTPQQNIIKRIHAAAAADFVTALYNPVSKKRRTLFTRTRDIMLQYRPETTPVAIASSLGRKHETLRYCTLKQLTPKNIDMLTIVIIGSSKSKLFTLGQTPHIYTPRGYANKILEKL